MSKYASLVADLSSPVEVTSRELATRAAASVQSSLFGRLRKARGSTMAGRLGWLLIRAAQPEHADYRAAGEALASMGETDLRAFLSVARAARDSLPDPAAAALAGAVAAAIEAALVLR